MSQKNSLEAPSSYPFHFLINRLNKTSASALYRWPLVHQRFTIRWKFKYSENRLTSVWFEHRKFTLSSLSLSLARLFNISELFGIIIIKWLALNKRYRKSFVFVVILNYHFFELRSRSNGVCNKQCTSSRDWLCMCDIIE